MNTIEYRAKVVPVANADWKEAALYFDKFMPVQRKFLPMEVCHGFNDRDLWEFASQIYLKKYREIFENPATPEMERNEQTLLSEVDIHSVWPIVQRLRSRGIPAIPIFAFRESYEVFGSGENEAIEVKLIDAKLVDAESLEWDQILEFRKDEDSVADLRNLRLFMFDNYIDKSPSYIRDSIEQKIEKHYEVTRKHGLNLVETVTSELVASKALLGSMCFATLSSLLGDHISFATIGGAGATIAIGKMTISIASKYVTYKTDTANPELAYVMKARKLAK